MGNPPSPEPRRHAPLAVQAAAFDAPALRVDSESIWSESIHRQPILRVAFCLGPNIEQMQAISVPGLRSLPDGLEDAIEVAHVLLRFIPNLERWQAYHHALHEHQRQCHGEDDFLFIFSLPPFSDLVFSVTLPYSPFRPSLLPYSLWSLQGTRFSRLSKRALRQRQREQGP